MAENITAGKYYRVLLTPEEHTRCNTEGSSSDYKSVRTMVNQNENHKSDDIILGRPEREEVLGYDKKMLDCCSCSNPEFLNEVLLRASAENGSQPDHSYEAVEVKKDDLLCAKWPEDKINLLLTLVAGITPHRKENNKQKKAAWEAISKIFKANGHDESGVTISKKWANLQDRYKIIKKRSTKSSGERVSWPYFGAMEGILDYLPSTPRGSSPSSDDSSSSSSSDSYYERKGRKERRRKKKKMAAHSKKRKVQEEVGDQIPTPQAPGWFVAYIKERNEEEKKWRAEISNIMKERNEAVKSLAASIAEFAKK